MKTVCRNGFFPLIQYSSMLINNLKAMGCVTKDDCKKLSAETLIGAGLPDKSAAALFLRFLTLYDHKGKGVKDIPDAKNKSADEIAALLELMRLPGVKAVRSELYYHCGLRSLADFANADADELRARIAEIITREQLSFCPPLPKELRTQIAVAKVFTAFSPNRSAHLPNNT